MGETESSVCPLAAAVCSLDSELCTKIGVYYITRILTQKNLSLEMGDFLMLKIL